MSLYFRAPGKLRSFSKLSWVAPIPSHRYLRDSEDISMGKTRVPAWFCATTAPGQSASLPIR